MDCSPKNFLLIWTIAFQEVVFGAGQDVVNVTSGPGSRYNITLNIIENKVTWYTAKESCPQEIPGSLFHIHGESLARSAGLELAMKRLSDSMIWIGRIKSGDDNNVYFGDGSCKIDSLLTTFVGNTEGQSNHTRCIALNTSSSTIPFGIEDCLQKHPYLCLDRHGFSSCNGKEKCSWIDDSQWVSTIYTYQCGSTVLFTFDWSLVTQKVRFEIDDTEQYEFYNKSVAYNPDLVYPSDKVNMSVEACMLDCTWWFSCLINIYDYTTNQCYKLIDKSANFYAEHNFSFTTSSSIFNIIRVKPARRAFIKIKTPSVNRTTHNGQEYKCTTPATEGTTPTTEAATQEPICYCSSCPKMYGANSSELEESIDTIKKSLTIDKQELSSTVRQLTSADDSRPSSKAFGLISALVLVLVVLFIISSDLMTLYFFLKKLVYRRCK